MDPPGPANQINKIFSQLEKMGATINTGILPSKKLTFECSCWIAIFKLSSVLLDNLMLFIVQGKNVNHETFWIPWRVSLLESWGFREEEVFFIQYFDILICPLLVNVSLYVYLMITYVWR